MLDGPVDTLIVGAALVDGSGAAPRRGELAILGGRMRLLPEGSRPAARRQVDAAGLHLAPGFIDVHTHDDTHVIRRPQMEEKLSQGVTTVVVGNCGISASPVVLRGAPPNPMNLLGDADAFAYPSFADYAAAVDAARPGTNVAALVGHTALRCTHMDALDGPADPAALQAMCDALATALEQGAIGLSSGLAYDSAAAAPEAEVLALLAPLARIGGVYTTHLRTEMEGVLDALHEALRTAGAGRVPLVVSHLKCAGAGTHGRAGELLDALDHAARSAPVACDCYPYAASASTLDVGQVRPGTRVGITWSTPHPEHAGRPLDEIARAWSVSEVEAARRLMPAGAVYHCMREDDVRRILAHPLTMIGSDGLPADPLPHPRLWGTFPRVLGHYCRDHGLFDLGTAVHRMTGLSAARFGLRGRGLLHDGAWADLVLFDAANVRDTASYAAPCQRAEGIVEVWVNGHSSLRAGQPAHGRAGRLLRRGVDVHPPAFS